jgi:hypothetical protein
MTTMRFHFRGIIVLITQEINAMNYFLDVTIADLISRYPNVEELLMGDELALFSSIEAIFHGGVLVTLREAINSRGIPGDLFLSLLARELFCSKSRLFPSEKGAYTDGSCNLFYETWMPDRLQAA